MNTTELAAECVKTFAPEADAELFERIFTRIHSYFRKLTGSQHAAEECTQEALLLLAQSLRGKKYDPQYSFNTWIWLKARSVFAQWCRKRSKLPQQMPESEPPDRKSRPDLARRLDGEALLDELARELGRESLEIFLLYYQGELTQAEIAVVVGRDPKTIRKRLDAAHALLNQLRAGP